MTGDGVLVYASDVARPTRRLAHFARGASTARGRRCDVRTHDLHASPDRSRSPDDLCVGRRADLPHAEWAVRSGPRRAAERITAGLCPRARPAHDGLVVDSPARSRCGMSDERGHRTVPHTADVIVEAWGPDRLGCLEELVGGVVESFALVRDRSDVRRVPIGLEPGESTSQVVALLDEVIYLVDNVRPGPDRGDAHGRSRRLADRLSGLRPGRRRRARRRRAQGRLVVRPGPGATRAVVVVPRAARCVRWRRAIDRGDAGAVADRAPGAMRVPGIVFACRRAAPGRGRGPVARAGRQRRDPARHRRGVVRDARRALGLRLPDRRGRRDRRRARAASSPPAGSASTSPAACGCCASDLTAGGRHAAAARPFMDELDRRIPRGLGTGGVSRRAGERRSRRCAAAGARGYAVERGHGVAARPASAARTAAPRRRGRPGRRSATGPANAARARSAASAPATTSSRCRSSTRSSTTPVADAFGLHVGQVCVMIHSGSRGLGHQICSDHVRDDARRAWRATASTSPTRSSPARRCARRRRRAYLRRDGGRRQLRARQPSAAHRGDARRVRRDARHARARLLYDVSHNLAKLEWHEVDGAARGCCACTARARPARCRPATPTSRHDLAAVRPAGARARLDGHRVVRARRRATAAARSTRPATAPAAR